MAGEWSWRLPFFLQMAPGLVLGIGILFLPFSPRWLVSKSRDFEAGQSLSKLRQLDISDSRVHQEYIDIRAEVGTSSGSTFSHSYFYIGALIHDWPAQQTCPATRCLSKSGNADSESRNSLSSRGQRRKAS